MSEDKSTRDELPEVMQVDHIQEFLGIGRRQAYEIVHNPPFSVVKVGRLYKISKVSFLKWFDGEVNEK
jgi:hypothetical protein